MREGRGVGGCRPSASGAAVIQASWVVVPCSCAVCQRVPAAAPLSPLSLVSSPVSPPALPHPSHWQQHHHHHVKPDLLLRHLTTLLSLSLSLHTNLRQLLPLHQVSQALEHPHVYMPPPLLNSYMHLHIHARMHTIPS
jgi:hypothetical protein